MRNDTREKFNALVAQVAKLSGVPDATQNFSVAPSVQQTLESKIQESSAFLRMINVQGVDDLTGEKLSLGISGPIASRTDYTQSERQTRDVSVLDGYRYECRPTEFDTNLPWAKLDSWSRFPDFQVRVRDALIRQQGLDRLMIGFNGTSAADATDRALNPQLQDVNIGWLQNYREHAPARVLSDGAAGTGEVRVGPGGDYANLDALIFDAVNNLIEPWHREAEDLYVVCGHNILPAKYFAMFQDHAETPTESLALDILLSDSRFGGLPAAQVPYMPDGALFITTPKNLSLYWQNGSRRRYIIDNPKRSRIENYESTNEAYVVEDFGAGCLIENIVFGDWIGAV